MWRLELTGITKRYPGVVANDGVGLRVAPGEIHAVLGENGAGKSTLMKVIYGLVTPDAGEMRWNGAPVRLASPAAARALGISMVFQHFSLFETLTVAENVALGSEPSVSLADISERIRRVAATYGMDLDPSRTVFTLSVGERQRVELVRSLLGARELLILDEPTSVLDPDAIEKLFVTLRRLASEGCSILYISHKLDEVRTLARRCTVLRGGRVVAEVDPAEETEASLARYMIGADPPAIERAGGTGGDVVFRVERLSLARRDPFGVSLEDVALTLRAGEVIGMAGISGNGQNELLLAISGEDRRCPRGTITLFGQDVAGAPPRDRRDRGLAFVPEERLGRATVPGLSLADNTLLTREEGIGPFGWLRPARLFELGKRLIDRFRVRAEGPNAAAESLSGGNLQKFVVGREIDRAPKVLVVSQPTWGVDVGAAAQIRGELLALRDAGTAVLVVSEDLEELFEISDGIVVMARGRLSRRLSRDAFSAAAIGAWMSGLFEEDDASDAEPRRLESSHA
jgi:simple sugar transport system ATP-binding protein